MDVLTENTLKPDQVSFGAEDRRFIYAIARRIVRSEQDADDVTQEAMLLAFRYREAFRGESRYHTWLHQIAATAALTFLRKGRRHRTIGVDAVGCDLADPSPSPEAAAAEREQLAMIAWLVEGLEPGYRDVLAMRVDERHEADIAAAHGISIANVKVRTHRARQSLRAQLELLTPREARTARCAATGYPRLRDERPRRARARRR